ncbi:MAG: hypothetical protein PHY94_04570 [Candidatus Omnitrophica bacterium]|nr:hypothetical protein [Candidatus Omnitrophota bacterium]
MKLVFASVMLFTLVFFGVGIAKADDITDMKEQIKALQETINTLNGKINTLETKQESQAVEIKKVPELDKKVSGLKQTNELLNGMNVGAHLKFALLDRTDGKRNGVNEHTVLSGGFFGRHNVVLYFSKELENWLKAEVQPEIDITSSATPSIGSDIGRTSSTVSTSLHQAFMTLYLPKGYEVKAGTFNAMFDEEYAKETWWHNYYNLNSGECTLESWHDAGVEVYKNFDFNKLSLPVYVSFLNGNSSDQFVDNNDNKAILVHVAPELFQGKLKLLTSYAYGLWGDGKQAANFRYLAGFDWNYQKYTAGAKYIYNNFKNLTTTGSRKADGRREGYVVDVGYKILPKWRALLRYSYVNLYKTGSVNMLSDKWNSASFILDYDLLPNSTIMGQYENADGHRSDGSESLRFNRFTIGWRTTF